MLHVPADYEIVIKPTKGWFKLNLADVWRYRDSLGLLVHREKEAERFRRRMAELSAEPKAMPQNGNEP